MELWKDTLETALNERHDAAFAELAESNADVREAVKQQRDASRWVLDHSGYDDELKSKVEEYFGAMQLLMGTYGRHLYIQGAKDCVTVLREFGVIK